MMRLSLTKLATAVGGAAIALTAGAGIASADPLDPVINTTCNYGQVMAALRASGRAPCAPLYARIDLLPGPADAPLVLELELAEPSVFLRYAAGAAERFAGHIAAALAAA